MLANDQLRDSRAGGDKGECMILITGRAGLEGQMQYHFSAVLGRDADGWWARCPELQGCYSQGCTYEQALDNLREAVTLHVEDRLACGEDIPPGRDDQPVCCRRADVSPRL